MTKEMGVSGIIVVCICLAMFFCGCRPYTPDTGQVDPPAAPGPAGTRLEKLFTAQKSQHPGASGLLSVRDGQRALALRLLLADAAEQSIEAQYYIWNSDASGRLLLHRLLMAAERGGRVRLLLDDFSVGDRNPQLLAIASHPLVEIRVYNPFVMRGTFGRWLNFAVDFDRLNRRMHNKTFVVDGTVAVTGGRNIGDEYFAAHEHLNFIDLDMFSAGHVVAQVAASFAEYWGSPWAVPIGELAEEKDGEGRLKEFMGTRLENPLQIPLPENDVALSNSLQALAGELVWAEAFFLADRPGGEEGAYADQPKRVARRLVRQAEDSDREIMVESAYFVLDDAALERVGHLRRRGVTMRVLTNSMASNDVLANYASYAKMRKEMLHHGIELHELRPDAPVCEELIGRSQYCEANAFLGLHAKAAVFDRRFVYVGSFNFNLRSAYLNTEAAMLVDSVKLAEALAAEIEKGMER